MSPPLRFRRKQRIRRQRDFRRIFSRRCAQSRGPVVLYVDDGGLDHPRLGLHVSKRVGNAVVRNREKRLLREAFRTSQHALPHLDMIVVLKKPGLSLAEYTPILRTLADEGAKKLARRRAATTTAPATGSPPRGRS